MKSNAFFGRNDRFRASLVILGQSWVEMSKVPSSNGNKKKKTLRHPADDVCCGLTEGEKISEIRHFRRKRFRRKMMIDFVNYECGLVDAVSLGSFEVGKLGLLCGMPTLTCPESFQ